MQAYSTALLNTGELRVLHDLRDYGLIYQPSVRPSFSLQSTQLTPLHQPTSSHFYPTRLATTLTSSAPPLVSSSHADEERGFLIIETNYKVYAYTSNPLQIAVLNLFVALRSRFPNLVTGVITRDSVKRGLGNGITANQVSFECGSARGETLMQDEQIISYLSSRAHPQMRKGKSLLPTTVVDQIRLWEQEGQRVQSADGAFFLPSGARSQANSAPRRIPLRRLFFELGLRPRGRVCARVGSAAVGAADDEEAVCDDGWASAGSVSSFSVESEGTG